MNQTEIDQLIMELGSEEPTARQAARDSLVSQADPDVTRMLVAELVDPHQHVRWEVAKALTAIADPVAAHGLLHALEDEDQDVRWVAAEGLIALRETGLLTVLSGLTRRARSSEFCRCAHHVLHDLKQLFHADVIDPVLEALDANEPEVAAPVAAYRALVTLKPLR